MLILLSPSKTQDSNIVSIPSCHSLPSCLSDSTILLDNLKSIPKAELAKLLGISANLAELNHQRYSQLNPNFTVDNAKPAIFTFKGDVYQGMEVDRYTLEQLDYAQAHLRIFSGFYGYLKPLDLIQPYRLEMGTKLANPRGSNLYDFWKTKLTALVNQEEQGSIINLSSAEYYNAIDQSKLQAQIITPIFKEFHKDQFRVIGIHAKRARGLMVNFMIKSQIQDVEEIKRFALAGYQFSPEKSSAHEWIFLR